MTIGTYAIVESGVVVNVILWDGNTENWQPPAGSTANALPVGSAVSIGWAYDGNNYTAPTPAPTPFTNP